MHTAAIVVFLVTYFGVALGGVPGLAVDRTGIAMLGAIAMVALGALDPGQALAAVDLPTILLLYGLMIFSAQFRLAGFYTWIASGLVRHLARPRLFLLTLMAVSAVLSALLANDIVCLAFTPVLCVGITAARLNPVPFLIGLAVSSNIGSAATIIGNPQNMLIGQLGGLDFARFFRWCAPPSLLAFFAAYGLILALHRGDWRTPETAAPVMSDPAWPEFNARQSIKGGALLAVLLALFFTNIPRELSALTLAGVFLCSRSMTTRSLLGHIDWHLITLFCGLFIVIGGISATGVPAALVERMAGAGFDLRNPYALTGVSVLLSNMVSNVPACMLLTQFLDKASPEQWYVLAVSSTLAGNLITIGSLANLIVIEQARMQNVRIGFWAHARVGIPVTLATLAILAGWIALTRRCCG